MRGGWGAPSRVCGGRARKENAAWAKTQKKRRGRVWWRSPPRPGAPWECFGIDMANTMNPVYMTSVTLPLGVLREMKK